MIYSVVLVTIKVSPPHLLPHSPHFPLPLFIPLKSELKVATIVYSEGEEVSAQALGSVFYSTSCLVMAAHPQNA